MTLEYTYFTLDQSILLHNLNWVLLSICQIVPMISILSSINCSVSLNTFDVFTFLTIFKYIVTSLQSLWFLTMQNSTRETYILYSMLCNWYLSLCSLQNSLISELWWQLPVFRRWYRDMILVSFDTLWWFVKSIQNPSHSDHLQHKHQCSV